MAEPNLFKANVSWKILTYFFENPSKEEYVKAVARALKMGPGSVSVSCNALRGVGLLKKTVKGNSLFYSLNNESLLVKRLKAAWFVSRLTRFKQAWEREEFVSVALYGSYASGEFVEKSDVDLLVLTNVNPKSVFENLKEIGDKLAAPVSPTVMPLSEWIRLSKKRDRFYSEVVSNHFLLWGSSIAV